PGQQAPGFLEFGLSTLISSLVNFDNGRHHLPVLQPVHEVLHARFDYRFGLHHRRATRISAALHHTPEIVHGIQIDIGQATDFSFDVAWHREVDHDHGLVTP